MKLLIALSISLVFGVVIGWHFEHRHAQREQITGADNLLVAMIESRDRLEAARSIRAIELLNRATQIKPSRCLPVQ